jgi:hypothetical protein
MFGDDSDPWMVVALPLYFAMLGRVIARDALQDFIRRCRSPKK